jgi:hypothetical protein
MTRTPARLMVEGEPMQEVQTDYETSLTLAAFRSPQEIDAAVRRLESIGISASRISRPALAPGRYQLEDRTFADVNAGLRKGAMAGLPIGAAVGLSLAAMATGAGLAALAGMAAVGAFGGGVLGGFLSSISRARFDDDSAHAIEIGADEMCELLVVRTTGGPGGEGDRARAVLKNAGAVGFLEPGLYDPDIEARRTE